MKDPRAVLKEELIKIGVYEKYASVISLDVGSSQTIVDKQYLSDFDLGSSLTKKSLDIINSFYNGDLQN